MTRLIDADALCEEFKERQRAALRWKEKAILDGDEERQIRADATLAFLSEVKLTIDNAPTVERPKGKWIYNKYNVWECSCCGGNPHRRTGYVPSIVMMKKQWKFCNLCGAQMEADNE